MELQLKLNSSNHSEASFVEIRMAEQTASQENVDPLNDHDVASTSDMEVRIHVWNLNSPK